MYGGHMTKPSMAFERGAPKAARPSSLRYALQTEFQ